MGFHSYDADLFVSDVTTSVPIVIRFPYSYNESQRDALFLKFI